MFGGGLAPGCEFSSAIREPHSMYAWNAAWNSGSEGRPASAAEREELLNYVKAGHLLAVLHSKARKSLKKKVS